MKKFNLYLAFLCAVLTFSLSVNAQKQSETTTKALELLTSGDFRGAISVLDKAIAKNKDLFESYKMRAMLKRMTGDFAGALSDYSSAIELKADDGELYEQRAMMRLYTRQSPELILEDLNLAISYGRKFEKVYSMRATIRRQLGDEKGAIADYETAIGLRPDYAQAHLGLASIYLMKRDDDKAASILENFIAMIENSGGKISKVEGEVVASSSVALPQDSDKNLQKGESSVIIVGKSVRGEKEIPPSQQELDKMTDKLEQSKNTALAYANLAAIYEKRKDYVKALATVEKAVKLDPTDFYSLDIRGKIKVSMGDYQGAIKDLDASVKMMPNIAPKYLERGIAYFMLGKEAEAQRDFDKYLQLFPNGKAFLDKRLEEAKQKRQQ